MSHIVDTIIDGLLAGVVAAGVIAAVACCWLVLVAFRDRKKDNPRRTDVSGHEIDGD